MRAGRAASVKPWPGRSGTITVKSAARSGATSRQECDAPPAPCTSSSAAPTPETCTCQRSPAACTKRLWTRPGQSPPSRAQSSRRAPIPIISHASAMGEGLARGGAPGEGAQGRGPAARSGGAAGARGPRTTASDGGGAAIGRRPPLVPVDGIP